MQLVLQKYSYGGVTLYKLDREAAVKALRSFATKLIQTRDDVLEVILFGSLAAGDAVPGSDADLLIVIKSSEKRHWFDRIEDFRDHFEWIGIPIELFPYTMEEIERVSLAKTAKETGKVLASR